MQLRRPLRPTRRRMPDGTRARTFAHVVGGQRRCMVGKWCDRAHEAGPRFARASSSARRSGRNLERLGASQIVQLTRIGRDVVKLLRAVVVAEVVPRIEHQRFNRPAPAWGTSSVANPWRD